MEIGVPLEKSLYPDSYWQQHDKWLAQYDAALRQDEIDWRMDMCFENEDDMEFSNLTPPLTDSGPIFEEVVSRVCSVLRGYSRNEVGKEWASCLQKDADSTGGEAAAIFTFKRIDSGKRPESIDCENSLKYMFFKKACPKGGFQAWPSVDEWRFTYRMIVRLGKCPEGIDVFHRSGPTRPF
ncbi:hypothetical protein NX059_006194 [Plenodomus lindquistii]|nr:hypothetical protein NX059_006194 [Plenodomus lindquistii]